MGIEMEIEKQEDSKRSLRDELSLDYGVQERFN